MIHVSEKEASIIKSILSKHLPAGEALVFGSRFRGTNKPYSDLDLAVKLDSKIDIAVIGAIQDSFTESELAFRVDVLDYWGISPEFRAIIDQGHEIIYTEEW
jgi:predicted nucleotidyltransferase